MMKRNFFLLLSFFALINFYCKKETSCEGCNKNNKPPIALAGLDQVITLPTDSVSLDGRNSSDPDGTISEWLWTKISGPASFIINNSSSSTPGIKNLVQGVYQFELKVTDNGGVFAKDTIQITVVAAVSSIACGGNRPTINAQLIPIGTLSQNRPFLSVASVGNKILFAGGSQWPIPPYATTRVDIYDTSAQSWSTAELSTPRWNIATVTSGTKVFFAGGVYYDDGDNSNSTDVVDIYDAATNQWSTAQLSDARHSIAAATVGDKVFFAGGQTGDYMNMSDKVDVYNLTTNSWSTTVLSQPRQYITAVTANDKIYFGGGQSGYNIINNNMLEAVASNRIDIYDHSSNSWSTGSLNEARYLLAGINHNNKIYWAGGWRTNQSTLALENFSCEVEIKDLSTQNASITYLNQPRSYFINGGQNAVIRNNQIVFFNGSRYLYSLDPYKNKFDIYDPANNTWYVGVLPETIEGASVISVNNTIYVAGGMVNGTFSNQVWKLEF